MSVGPARRDVGDTAEQDPEGGSAGYRSEAPADLGLDALLNAVATGVGAAQDAPTRWRLLLDTVVSISADASLEELLEHIAAIGSRLVDARYAALGVIGSAPGRPLRAFGTHGLTEGEVAAIGEPPRGSGVIGLLIDRPQPVRLEDVQAHPLSVGFPAGHPEMHSFLGVPVISRGEVFGNLYLTEKRSGGAFTEDDEQLVVALATAAGVAIENTLLREDAARRQRWLTATAEITTRLMSEASEEESLQLIADEAREVSGADLAWIVAGPNADRLEVRVASGMELDPVRLRASGTEYLVAGAAVRAGGPIAVENLAEQPHVHGYGVEAMRAIGPVAMFPLRDADPARRADTDGALALGWRHENAQAAQELDPELPGAFAQQAALALRLARSRREQQQLTLYEDRDRIARDLHDMVIQKLFSVGLSLQTVYRRTTDPDLAQRIDGAAEGVDDAIREIRRTIFELGRIEEVDDIVGEIRRIVARAASALKFRPELTLEGPVRLGIPSRVQPDLMAVLGEALSNASRHAEASAVRILLHVGPEITLRVTDDGRGISAGTAWSGLANMRRRAEDHGGRCVVSSAEPHGTTIEWTVPLRPEPARSCGPECG